jgi:hypothetical protein
LHRYLYAKNKPVNRVDPTGEFSTEEAVTVGAIVGIISANAILRPETVKDSVKVTLAGAAVGALVGLGAALYVAGAFTVGTAAVGGGGAGGAKLVERITEGIRATRGGTINPQTMGQIKNDMLNGDYRFASPEGQIGGYLDSFGRYFIGEGHTRMAAALAIAEETGNTEFVQRLLEYGRWTPGVPGESYPFPPLP